MEVIADGGAYAYTSTKVLANATLMCTGPYEIENVNVDTYAVYTNNIPGGAFRGFGGPQGAFAAESQMNKLAEKLHIDPVELRMRNLLQEGSLLSTGTPLPEGVSLKNVAADVLVRLVGNLMKMDGPNQRSQTRQRIAYFLWNRICVRIQKCWFFLWVCGRVLGNNRTVWRCGNRESSCAPCRCSHQNTLLYSAGTIVRIAL